jgi:hypothetical protein
MGAAAATARLAERAVLASAALTLAGVIVVAWAAHRFVPDEAVDYSLGGVVFGVALPLVAYAVVARVCRQGRLDVALRPLARHGADRRSATLGLVAATALRVAALGAACASFAVLVARGHLDGRGFIDAMNSAWIGALGGAVYVAWFSLGSVFGKSGGGRSVALALDWIFGSAPHALAMPWPRAHLRSLLGGELVVGLPEWQSTVALYLLAAVYLVATALRVAR